MNLDHPAPGQDDVELAILTGLQKLRGLVGAPSPVGVDHEEADDSGLEVEALGGKPGIFSARFAGECATSVEKCRELLSQLKEVPEEGRGAAFQCVVALARRALAGASVYVYAVRRSRGWVRQAVELAVRPEVEIHALWTGLAVELHDHGRSHGTHGTHGRI
ncbi:MAG: hypothetical protein IH881_06035 [Myxococcales bacterium]|nr:hypothetical protein [Myxococcales bacterium]